MGKYHKYDFDIENRRLVGDFEAMYREEDAQGFDSWHERDQRLLRKSLSRVVLERHNFDRILEIGCGKGAFTQFLKKENNTVVAIDLSPTAIAKARASYPDIDFRCMKAEDVGQLGQDFDLAVVMATLAYVPAWPTVLESISRLARWIYVAEYIPPNPIGCVKSGEDLRRELARHYDLKTTLTLDDHHFLFLGERRAPTDDAAP